MRRGTISLHTNIFDEPVATPATPAPPSLRAKKIECIISYYYYHGRRTKMSYAPLIKLVADAFFLSTYTIQDIMQDNLTVLTDLKLKWKEQAVEKLQKQLQAKWPQLVW